MSQSAILEQNAIQNQALRELKFPAKPPTSQDAKNFIKKCLIYDVNLRPDVLSLANDEFLRPSTYKSKHFIDTSISSHHATPNTGD